MLQVILLRLLWMREELQVQQSNCPGVKLWSRTRRPKFLLLHCVVHVLLEGAENLHNLFHLGGEEAVTVTTLVVSLDNFSLTLTDNTTGEGNTLTTVHTTYDPGFMTILTECVRAYSVMDEFINKFPDRKNVTFEETDGGLDRSHESHGAAFNTKDTVDDCTMYCGDWNWLQRNRYGVHVWPDGAQEEDQWEYDIAPR